MCTRLTYRTGRQPPTEICVIRRRGAISQTVGHQLFLFSHLVVTFLETRAASQQLHLVPKETIKSSPAKGGMADLVGLLPPARLALLPWSLFFTLLVEVPTSHGVKGQETKSHTFVYAGLWSPKCSAVSGISILQLLSLFLLNYFQLGKILQLSLSGIRGVLVVMTGSACRIWLGWAGVRQPSQLPSPMMRVWLTSVTHLYVCHFLLCS